MCESLAQIEGLGFPFLDVAGQIFHLFTDRITARLKFLNRIGAEKLDEFLLLHDFIVELQDLGVPWTQVFRERFALSFEELHLLLRFEVFAFRAYIRERHALRFAVISGYSRRGIRLGILPAIEILIEVQFLQKLVLGFQPGEILIQLHQVLGGAVPFFLDETDVVLFLEIK